MGRTNQVGKGQVPVRNDSLDLVELGKMCRVDRLVPEDTVDTEELGRLESSRLVGDFVEHGGGDGGGVRAEDEAGGLFLREGVAVSCRPEASDLVDGLDALKVVFWESLGLDGVCWAASARIRGKEEMNVPLR